MGSKNEMSAIRGGTRFVVSPVSLGAAYFRGRYSDHMNENAFK